MSNYTFLTGDYFEITDGVINLKAEYRAEGLSANSLPEYLEIPDTINNVSVTGLAVGMFQNHNRIKGLKLPTTATTIPNDFCYTAKNLIIVLNTDNITTIGTSAFQDTPLQKAYFPKIQTLGIQSFARCGALTEAILSNDNSFTTIPKNCFNYCCRLASVYGGAKIKTIDVGAFRFCFNLSYLPDIIKGLKSSGTQSTVGGAAFFGTNMSASDVTELNNAIPSENFGDLATAKQVNSVTFNDWVSKQNSNTLHDNIIYMPTKLHQANPLWKDAKIGSYIGSPCTTFEGEIIYYRGGCQTVSAWHSYCSIRGYRLSTMEEVEKQLLADAQKLDLIDGGNTHETNLRDGFRSHNPYAVLIAVGINCRMKTTYENPEFSPADVINTENFVDTFYSYMQEKGTCGMITSPNHDMFCMGTNKDGQIMILDSGSSNSKYGDYTALSGTLYPQNIVSDIESGINYYFVCKEGRSDVFKPQKTLADNVAQVISDFDNIKTAIVAKGVSIPTNTPTSQYGTIISNIQTGDTLSAHGSVRFDNDATTLTISNLGFRPKRILITAINDSLYIGKYSLDLGYGGALENSAYLVNLVIDLTLTNSLLDKLSINIYKHLPNGQTTQAMTILTAREVTSWCTITDNGFTINLLNNIALGGQLYFAHKGARADEPNKTVETTYYWSAIGE